MADTVLASLFPSNTDFRIRSVLSKELLTAHVQKQGGPSASPASYAEVHLLLQPERPAKRKEEEMLLDQVWRTELVTDLRGRTVYQLRNKGSGLVLDAAEGSTDSGTRAILWFSHTQSNERHSFIQVKGSPSLFNIKCFKSSKVRGRSRRPS